HAGLPVDLPEAGRAGHQATPRIAARQRLRPIPLTKMPQKRIAIVANTTWNIRHFRLNVLRRLIDDGYAVVVMAPVDKFITYTERMPEVTHVPLRHLDRDSVNPFQDLLLCWELYRLYGIHKPDLVLHYTVKPNIYGGLAARLR